MVLAPFPGLCGALPAMGIAWRPWHWASHIPWFWSLTGFAYCSIVMQDKAIFYAESNNAFHVPIMPMTRLSPHLPLDHVLMTLPFGS